jgi:hypothetical protein
MVRKYFIALNNISEKIKAHFDFLENRSYGRATEKDINKIPHAEWIPNQLKSLSKDIDGASMRWQSREDAASRLACMGSIKLLPIEHIYGDWQGIVYFDFTENPRLRDFKIVDFFADEACVGLYHDAEQDPGLYLYDFERGPYALHLDLNGYFQLLELTLGYSYWQRVVLDLLAGEESPKTRQFRQDMSDWVPGFDYAAFVALYHEVKLPSAPPA